MQSIHLIRLQIIHVADLGLRIRAPCSLNASNRASDLRTPTLHQLVVGS